MLLQDPLLFDSVYLSCPAVLLHEGLPRRVLEAQAQRRTPDGDPVLEHESYERAPRFRRDRVILVPLSLLP